jgi:hypothetical protein
VITPQLVPIPVPLTPLVPPSTLTAAPAAPSVRPVVVPSGTPAVRARPVQAVTELTADGDRASTPGETTRDEDHSPALDLVTDPDDQHPKARTAPVESAPVITHALLRGWDDAITACVADGDESFRPASAVSQSPAVVTGPPASALESTLMAGVAVALWGCWEVRSWRDDWRVRRSYLRHVAP